MKIWAYGSSPRSESRYARKWIKNVNGASRLRKFWIFFGAIQMISCRDWWLWTKPAYITVTRRQSNNQWSRGIAAHPSPKKFRVQKSAGKVLALIFSFVIKTASSSLIIFQRAKLSTWSINPLYWCNRRTFKGETPREGHQRGLVLAQQCPGSPGTCSPEETGLPGLPVSWSPILFSGSGPVRLPPFPGLKKKIEMSPFFVRRGGHCCRGDLVGWTRFWIFWVACRN